VLVVVSSDCTAIVPAFLSVEQYEILCENNTPFLCPSCYLEQPEAEVKGLKGTVETLKVELSQLKELLREVQGQVKHSARKS